MRRACVIWERMREGDVMDGSTSTLSRRLGHVALLGCAMGLLPASAHAFDFTRTLGASFETQYVDRGRAAGETTQSLFAALALGDYHAAARYRFVDALEAVSAQEDVRQFDLKAGWRPLLRPKLTADLGVNLQHTDADDVRLVGENRFELYGALLSSTRLKPAVTVSYETRDAVWAVEAGVFDRRPLTGPLDLRVQLDAGYVTPDASADDYNAYGFATGRLEVVWDLLAGRELYAGLNASTLSDATGVLSAKNTQIANTLDNGASVWLGLGASWSF